MNGQFVVAVTLQKQLQQFNERSNCGGRRSSSCFFRHLSLPPFLSYIRQLTPLITPTADDRSGVSVLVDCRYLALQAIDHVGVRPSHGVRSPLAP